METRSCTEASVTGMTMALLTQAVSGMKQTACYALVHPWAVSLVSCLQAAAAAAAVHVRAHPTPRA